MNSFFNFVGLCLGAGLAGLDKLRGKMENLMVKPKVVKSKNIKLGFVWVDQF